MGLKIGIVGLPNVGKSTLFAALTKKEVDINNYPFCTINPNVGIVNVKDERLDQLWSLYPEGNKVEAIIEFVDIAGLVRNAHKGEGLGNQFLGSVRNVDVIVEVVRAFKDTNITHTEERIDPLADIEIIQTELLLSDLELIQKRLQRLEKMKRSVGKEKEEAEIESEILSTYEKKLNDGQWLYPLPEFPEKLIPFVKKINQNFSLLTTKPILYVINMEEDADREELKEKLKNKGISEEKTIYLDIKFEKEIEEMSQDERNELNLQSQLDVLVQKAYKLLNLLTFFTAGDKETRAWTTKNGAQAPQAAGVIHSDFENYFVCAQIINYLELIKQGSWKNAKQVGLIRTEGKNYQMKEGDVVEFMFNK